MSFRIAWDTMPDDPNPHPWELDSAAFPTYAMAEMSASSELEELVREYGEEYAYDNGHYLVVEDKKVEVNVK